MTLGEAEIVVAGHVCLDVIPALGGRAKWQPGKLVQVGPAVVATGGAVSNTGLALHRLGAKVRLVGKVGDDVLGRAVLDVLRSHGDSLADGMVVAKGESTSYSVVISPPGTDRMFLHHPGANDTFCAADIPWERLKGASHFHFGYPTLMMRMYEDGGRELETIFSRARESRMTTSLDLTMVDPKSEAAKADWEAIFERVLPHVTYFLPSYEEIAGLLWKKRAPQPDVKGLRAISDRLLRFDVYAVGLKMGDRGLYFRATPNNKLDSREHWIPCFEVDVAGTTGAGDCAIAGFLAAQHACHPQDVKAHLRAAVAVGACCVEAMDAVSGVRPWSEIEARIAAGWKQKTMKPPARGWNRDGRTGVWTAPG